jgi:hypothetical protein
VIRPARSSNRTDQAGETLATALVLLGLVFVVAINKLSGVAIAAEANHRE